MKVAVFSTKRYDQDFIESSNERLNCPHEFVFYEATLDASTVSLAKDFEGVCVFVNDNVSGEILQELDSYGVRVVALRCAGYNNVDLKVARKMNIKVVRVPSYSPHAVAEHAVALIMTLNRKTHKAYNRVREHNFALNKLMGFDLKGKTVGVIGTGKIGLSFCKIMLGFGCKVRAFDLYPNEDLENLGVQYISLDDLCTQSDIISLHCPLTKDTYHLINEGKLELMKEGVMLINTSRGALINTPDVIQALKRRKLGYLGLDVYEEEEDIFFKDLSEDVILDDQIARLMSFPNVLITGHQAFFTREAMDEIASTTIQNLCDIEKYNACENEITVND